MSISEITGNLVSAVVGGAARYAPEPVASFASQLTGSGSQVNIAPEYKELLEKQFAITIRAAASNTLFKHRAFTA
jgi:hypothetical protein